MWKHSDNCLIFTKESSPYMKCIKLMKQNITKHFLSCKPPFRISVKHFLHKVLCIIRDFRPRVPLKINDRANDCLSYPLFSFWLKKEKTQCTSWEYNPKLKSNKLFLSFFFFLISKKFYSRRLEVHKACTQQNYKKLLHSWAHIIWAQSIIENFTQFNRVILFYTHPYLYT